MSELLIQPQSYTLPIVGVIGLNFKLTDLLMHLHAAKESPVIECVMDSPGGYIDEGLKIADALAKCGKRIKMRNSGDVASIAVSIFLTAQKGDRTFDPSKGQFLIHCPLVDPKDMGDTAYTAEDLTFMAKQLKSYESDLVKQYVNATGADGEILKAFMAENKPLTPDQISTLGFAQIEQPQFKAVALINNQLKMEAKQVQEKLNAFEIALNALTKLFRPKNLLIQDVNGMEIDFGEAVQTPEQIVVGVTATVDGKPAEGEFTLADGMIYVFAAGTLTEIKPAENAMEVEIEALKKENEDLKSQLTASTEAINQMKAENEKALNEVEKVKKDFTAFKNQFSNEPPVRNAPTDSDPKTTNRVAKYLKKE